MTENDQPKKNKNVEGQSSTAIKTTIGITTIISN
jgi:hypothetical protein